MFGQTPRLPVDFLLAGVEDPVMGSVEDWVARHQEGLRVTYGRVKTWLEAAAEQRKTLYDQTVRKNKETSLFVALQSLPAAALLWLKFQLFQFGVRLLYARLQIFVFFARWRQIYRCLGCTLSFGPCSLQPT